MATKKTTKAIAKTVRKPTKSVSGGRKKAGLIVHADDRTFQKEIHSTTVPVLVDFSATWCPPCQLLAKALPEIAEAFAGKVKVVKVDVDESPKTAGRYAGESVPSLVLFRNGKPVTRDVGFGSKRETEKWLKGALQRPAGPGSRKPSRPTCCCG